MIASLRDNGFLRKYSLTQEGQGCWRPSGARMAPLCRLEVKEGKVALVVSQAGLSHPVLSPPLKALVRDFLTGVAEAESLEGLFGDQELERKLGDQLLRAHTQDGERSFEVGKARKGFWPFRRSR